MTNKALNKMFIFKLSRSEDSEERELSMDESSSLKGIAILMMMNLHLFGEHPNNIAKSIAMFCNICVPIYVFLSGYGLGKSSKRTIKDSLIRIGNFYRLWLPIFIVCAFIYIFIVHIHVDVWELFANATCLSYSYNHIWWFTPMYYGFLLMFPFLYKLLDSKESICILLFVTIAIKIVAKVYIGDYDKETPVYFPEIIIVILNSLSIWLPLFIVGILYGRFSIYSRLNHKTPLAIMLFAFYVVYTFFPLKALLVLLLTPAFCFSLKRIDSSFFRYMGTLSPVIWLYHGTFLAIYPRELNYFLTYLLFVIIMIIIAEAHNRAMQLFKLLRL